MGFFGNHKNKSEVTLIFDIGSSSVGGALVQYEEDKLPLILFSVRKEILFKEDFDFDEFYASMLRSLEEVTIDVLSSLSSSVEDVAQSLSQSSKRILGRGSQRQIKNVYCVFSSPWYVPKIVDLSNDYGKEVPITPDVVWEFVKGAARGVKESFADPQSIGILEERVLEYRLNGYRIDDPISLRAKTADLKLYLSVVYKQTMSAIKAPIRKIVSYRKIRSFSFLMIFFSLMRDVHPDRNSFITFDMRGEVTEVGVTNDDVLTHAFSVPWGKHTLLRDLAAKLHIELFEASAKLALFLSGKLEGETQKEVGFLIEEEILHIRAMLKEKLAGEIYLPDQVYVLSDQDIETVAERAARSLYEDTLVSPEIAILSDQYFENHATFSKSRYADRFLVVQALYFRNSDITKRE
ncbi:MAG: hypothetical protein WDZ74_00045 [Candidatus Paceibacterota bacterium]